MKITDAAVSKINAMVIKESIASSNLRIAIVGGGCSGYSYDIDFEKRPGPESNDFVFEYDNFKVYVDAMSFQYLDGAVMDYTESFQFSGFNFINPNAKHTCGCGSSFAI